MNVSSINNFVHSAYKKILGRIQNSVIKHDNRRISLNQVSIFFSILTSVVLGQSGTRGNDCLPDVWLGISSPPHSVRVKLVGGALAHMGFPYKTQASYS